METAKPLEFFVSGMTCAGCVAKVTKALLSVPGVKDANVSLMTRKARVVGDVDFKLIAQKLPSLGYQVALSTSATDGMRERRMLTIRTFSALPLAILVMLIHMGPVHFHQGHLLQAVLSTIVVLGCGWPILVAGVKSFRTRVFTMDTLVTLGVVTAMLFSFYQWSKGDSNLYFETGTVIVAVVLLGRFLESRQRQKTREALDHLMRLQVKELTVQRAGKELTIPTESIEVGDLVQVRPGDLIPIDGFVRRGLSTVDESLFTGESLPVEKAVGSQVISGTKNVDGVLFVEVNRVTGESMLQQLIQLVDSAQSLKSPVQRMVDKVSGAFTVAVALVGLFSFLGWGLITGDWMKGLIAAISVFVVACPCALGLATPAALVVAVGRASRRGILVRDLQAFEVAPKITHFLFDKTGTLTEGRPQIVHMDNDTHLSDRIYLQLIASAEKYSEHPIGKMIVREAVEKRAVALIEPQEFRVHQGKGISALVDGHRVQVGTWDFLKSDNIKDFESDKWKAFPGAVFTAIDGTYAGVIVLADPIKSTAAKALALLRRSGIPMEILTGDHQAIANDVAMKLGMDCVKASQTPHDKLQRVLEHQEKKAVVAFAGDGANDAPVLAQADLSFAMGKGSEIAIHSAMVTLVKGDLMNILTFFRLANRTMSIIRQNLFWAFGYNLIGLPLAAFGKLSPMLAATTMAFSSVAVVTNSLRLRRF